jgi:hypothetical protein
MAEAKESEAGKAAEKELTEDDKRAQAAAVNRKRTLQDWEDKKKRWLEMGVPAALPAAGSKGKK